MILAEAWPSGKLVIWKCVGKIGHIRASSADELCEKQSQLQARLNAVKIAYLNGEEFDGKPVNYQDLKLTAQELIQTNYALQKSRYGSIRLKLSVAKLLRRGQ